MRRPPESVNAVDDGGVDSLDARTNNEFNDNKVKVLSGKYSKDHSTLCFVVSLGLTFMCVTVLLSKKSFGGLQLLKLFKFDLKRTSLLTQEFPCTFQQSPAFETDVETQAVKEVPRVCSQPSTVGVKLQFGRVATAFSRKITKRPSSSRAHRQG